MVLIGILLPLFPAPVEAVVRLNSDHVIKTTSTGFTSTTYTNYSTLNLTISNIAGQKTMVYASVSVSPSSTSAKPKVRFQVDGVTVSEYDTGFTFLDALTPTGQTYTLVSYQDLAAGSHSITIDIANSTGLGSITALNSSIIAMQLSDNSFKNTITSETCTGANTDYQKLNGMDVSPIATGTHLFLWSAEVKHEDEGDTNNSVRFRNTTNNVTYTETLSGDLATTTNNNVYYSMSGVALDDVTVDVTENYGIEVRGNGTSDETCIRNSTIVAIPLSDFPASWTDTQSTNTFHRTTTFSDSLLSITQTLTADTYLFFAGVEISNETSIVPGGWRLNVNVAGVDAHNFVANQTEDRDGDLASPEFFGNSFLVATTTRAASYIVRVQGRSQNTSSLQEGMIRRGTLAVIKIKGPGNADPVVDSVEDSPDNVNAGANVQFDTYWTDEDQEGVKMLICKTNAITAGASPSCPGGNWCTNVDDYETGSPVSCQYTTVNPTDIGTKNYWAFVCDDEPACSTGVAGSFVVVTPPTPISILKLFGQAKAFLQGLSKIKLF